MRFTLNKNAGLLSGNIYRLNRRLQAGLALLLLCLVSIGSSYGQAISPYLMGQNAWLPTALGNAVYNGQLDKLWPVVQESKVQMVRIGGNGVEFNLPTMAQYIALIDSIRKIGAEPMVQVPEGRGRYTAQQAAAVVDHVNNVMNRNVTYWIIGNEPNLVGSHPTVDAAGVAAYHKAWATAMKLKDPSILIVGPECAFYDSNYYPALVGGAHDITGQDENGNYYIDVVSFHTYPFNGTQTRAQVVASAQSFAGNVDRLIGLMDAANSKHGRTGSNRLQWALTEFNVTFRNPADNTVEGVNVHSFLNGQYWAEVFNVGMQKGALSIQPWSIHESGGARVPLDLGYLDGSIDNIKPRSSYYHEMLIAENVKGTYVAATDNQTNITAFGSTFGETVSIMILNKSLTENYAFDLQLSEKAVVGAAPLQINLLAGIDAAYAERIAPQSTLVLLFDKQGNPVRKIVYSLQHAARAIPPTYLAPGENITLVGFSANKQTACVTQDRDAVVFDASILGPYKSLTWNFGEGATPQTATGPGPISVSYTTLGAKTVSLTVATEDDQTIVETKAGYIQARSCVRESFLEAPAPIPGVMKAVNFDIGGQDIAYNDSDVANRGALLDPTVPRADESVDTENGGEGIGNIGYTADGEWTKYTVAIKKTGNYKITVRVASQPGGGALRLSVNDVDKTGIVQVPQTAGWAAYQNLVINNVQLEASEKATLKFDIVKSGFNTASFTFEEQALTEPPSGPGIVVNRVYNGSNDGNGRLDALELLVVTDRLDIRGMVVKDVESNITADNGGKYRFNDIPLWQNLRAGTTIVLRQLAGPSGYAQDSDPADFTLDLLMENTDFVTKEGSGTFNITQTDMVLIKTGEATGIAGTIHAFATRGGGVATSLYNQLSSPKLVSPNTDAGGDPNSTHYPLNLTLQAADYNGNQAAISRSTTDLNWGNGFGEGNSAYIAALRASTLEPVGLAPGAIVVNRVYNGSNDAAGTMDAVELLVIKDQLDIRDLIVKDFETNLTTDNGGKYRFNDLPFWQNLRSGTTIVLRKVSGGPGYVQDTDASDFTIDLLLENTTYLTNVSSGNVFNITQTDMVLLKTGPAAGVDGAIHAFGTRGGGSNGIPSAIFTSVQAPKLVSPNTDAGGDPSSMHYPLNPDGQISDYNGAKGAISKSTNRTWGFGFGAGNTAYIQALRDGVLASPSNLTVTATANSLQLSWTDNATNETGYEVLRSLDGTTYALVATVGANSTSFTDPCLANQTRYHYKVRAKAEETLYSTYSAAVTTQTGTGSTPSIGVSRTDATFTGLDANTLALGYGAQQLTLSATSTGTGTFSYTWAPAVGLSNATVANPVFAPTSAGTYTITVTSTDAFGCTASAAVTIQVIDVRCGNNNDKVLVCRKTGSSSNQEVPLCINQVDVANHLRTGSTLGACSSVTATGLVQKLPYAVSKLAVYPSPFARETTVSFTLGEDEATVSLDLYDLKGRKVREVYVGRAQARQEKTVSFSSSGVPAGMYFFRLTGQKETLLFRVVITE